VHKLCSQGDPIAGIARRDSRGRDAVMLAAEKGFDTCVQILLTFAPAVSAAFLTLHPEISAGQARGLSPAEALLMSQDMDGNTALHFASANGHLLVLRTLLAAGADPERRNGWSWTAVSYSATVQAEVYFRNLVQEREEAVRKKKEGKQAYLNAQGAGMEKEVLSMGGRGLRLVQDD